MQRIAENIHPAIDQHDIRDIITALGLAYSEQAVLRGAFILATVKGNRGIACNNTAHLKRDAPMMFGKA